VLGGARRAGRGIFDTMELTEEADFERRGIMQTMEHPIAGPFKIAGLAGALRRAHAGPQAVPLLGQHTSEVLGEWLGLDADQIDQLSKTRSSSYGRVLINCGVQQS